MAFPCPPVCGNFRSGRFPSVLILATSSSEEEKKTATWREASKGNRCTLASQRHCESTDIKGQKPSERSQPSESLIRH